MGILAILFMVTARIQAQDRDSTAVLDHFRARFYAKASNPVNPCWTMLAVPFP